MALTILQRDITIKENIRGKRLRAGWDDNVLDQIYAGFTAINVRFPWQLCRS